MSASRALRKLCISLGSNASRSTPRQGCWCEGPSDAILAAISSISSCLFSKSSGDQVSGASRECSDVLELSLERTKAAEKPKRCESAGFVRRVHHLSVRIEIVAAVRQSLDQRGLTMRSGNCYVPGTFQLLEQGALVGFAGKKLQRQ